MLMEKIKGKNLSEVLLPQGAYQPFPTIDDREGWSAVTEVSREIWIKTAEEYMDFPWPALRASWYMDFHKNGENIPFLFPFFTRRGLLGTFVIAECIENQGRFIDQIVTGIYCICEETTWMTPFDLFSGTKNKMPALEDVIVDLACSETATLLVYVRYLMQARLDAINPRICQRIFDEVYRRAVRPYLDRNDYWWMGFVPQERINNWNPWCNGNMLACLLLLPIEEAERLEGMEKLLRSLDRYMEEYPQDGCCDEGPAYWCAAGGGLNGCLETLKDASGGLLDIFDVKIVQDIGRYISTAFIDSNYFVNYADGDAKVGVGSAAYMYGKNIKDRNMMALGAGGEPARPGLHHWFGLGGYLKTIFTEVERRDYQADLPYVRDSWMPFSHTMSAREQAGSSKGFFLAAKSGHNAESHNHNDVGNFIVYVDGKPLFVDVGTEEYTAKTFGSDRYSIWYIGSLYHNCPSVNGVAQHAGREFAGCDVSYDSDDTHSRMSMNIAGAYPKEAGIDSWVRTVSMERGGDAVITITDRYSLEKPSIAEYHFMTVAEPVVAEDGLIRLHSASGRTVYFRFDANSLTPEIEFRELSESRLVRNWGNAMYRITLKEKSPTASAERTVKITRD